jgi:NAD+-dependent protein deacetylase SIR2
MTDQSRRPATKNGYAKNASSRIRELVDYDEKRHMEELREDIEHGVAHPTVTEATMTELEERVNDLGDSWETESLFADVIGDLAEDRFFTEGKQTDKCLATNS